MAEIDVQFGRGALDLQPLAGLAETFLHFNRGVVGRDDRRQLGPRAADLESLRDGRPDHQSQDGRGHDDLPRLRLAALIALAVLNRQEVNVVHGV